MGMNSDTRSMASTKTDKPMISRHERSSSLLHMHDIANVYENRLNMDNYEGSHFVFILFL